MAPGTDIEKAQRLLSYIDGTIRNIYDQLQTKPYGKPSITLKRIAKLKPQQSEDGELRWEIESREVTYSFPGKNKDEAWRFTCLLRILDVIHGAIHQNIIVTKRDIFYRDPELFGKQDTVDRYIEDIAHTCGVQRIDLHVIASPKGLVVGLQDSDQPETIPTKIDGKDLSGLRWILVVEKEATLQALADQKFHRSNKLNSGLIVTAKGYPDLATLRFLRMVLDHSSYSGPIFGLFDFDPYGIEILRCYLVGSKVSQGDPKNSIPEMKWLGVKFDQVANVKHDTILTLTDKDRAKAGNMIEATTMMAGGVIPGLEECRTQLQRMLMTIKKAEIQTMESTFGLISWLEDEMLVDVWNGGW